MKNLCVLSFVACVALVVGCGAAPSETVATAEVNVEQAPAAEAAAEARHDMVYVCSCGEDCDCNTVATEPGNCACGNELKAAHLVKVEGNEGLLCSCEEGCTCEINSEDETNSLGIRRIQLADTCPIIRVDRLLPPGCTGNSL